MAQRTWIVMAALAMVGLLAAAAQAAMIETVPVGNPGNDGELSGAGAGSYGPDAIVGGVAYSYQIDRYEVTNAQYVEFLNAVAAIDRYGLYNTLMWTHDYGCKIQRSGSSGSYTYSVASDRAQRPVNYVSWGDAARFANWLDNGQPTGTQGLSTTEDGSYYLNGARSQAALMAVTRKTGATWVIPTEDEWYKAAYHKNDGVTAHYWDYPMGTDAIPNNGNPEGDTGNSANLYDWDDLYYTVGAPYYTTPVGYFGLSASPYGTFDQGGNLWEWNETVISAGSKRGIRGGDWDDGAYDMFAPYRYGGVDPTVEGSQIGFRVASIPEPASITLFVCGAVASLSWWRRRR